MPASHKENDMLASTVLLQTESGSFNAYLARSDRPNGAGIVVLQEIFGVNANMRAVSDAFSAAGFNAIVPDLFWRQQPDVHLDPATDRERATELMKGLNTELAVADALVGAFMCESQHACGLLFFVIRRLHCNRPRSLLASATLCRP